MNCTGGYDHVYYIVIRGQGIHYDSKRVIQKQRIKLCNVYFYMLYCFIHLYYLRSYLWKGTKCDTYTPHAT